MGWLDSIPLDPELTPRERERVEALTPEELVRIDAALLQQASGRFHKIARIVGNAMNELCEEIPGVVDLFYGERVRALIEAGALEVQGDPRRMRFSEVRVPD